MNIEPHLQRIAFIASLALAGCASNTPPQTGTSTGTAQAPTASGSTRAPTSTPTQSSQSASGRVEPSVTGSAYFDYDQFNVKPQYEGLIRQFASVLARNGARVTLQGFADERGSREYNMALGQKRADAVKNALSALGVKATNIECISFGEDKPKATGHDEVSWAENRRVDFVVTSK